jgi:hypothetical protein
MPDLVPATCLVLVVVLVVASVTAFVWSDRKNAPMGFLVGLGALVMAGVPAAAYGAMAAS